MSIWSTPTIRGIECGALCKDCGFPITDNPEGEPRLCDECQEASEKCDKHVKNENPLFYKMKRN